MGHGGTGGGCRSKNIKSKVVLAMLVNISLYRLKKCQYLIKKLFTNKAYCCQNLFCVIDNSTMLSCRLSFPPIFMVIDNSPSITLLNYAIWLAERWHSGELPNLNTILKVGISAAWFKCAQFMCTKWITVLKLKTLINQDEVPDNPINQIFDTEVATNQQTRPNAAVLTLSSWRLKRRNVFKTHEWRGW